MKWLLLLLFFFSGFLCSSLYAATINCGSGSTVIVSASSASSLSVSGVSLPLVSGQSFSFPCTGSIDIVYSSPVAVAVVPSFIGVDTSGYSLHDVLISGFIMVSIGLGFLVGAKYV